MNKHELWALFRVSFIIAVIIFVTAILYDFSVTMYHTGTDWFVRVGSGLFGVIVMSLVIMLVLWWMPDVRKAILRMFGLDEEA